MNRKSSKGSLRETTLRHTCTEKCAHCADWKWATCTLWAVMRTAGEGGGGCTGGMKQGAREGCPLPLTLTARPPVHVWGFSKGRRAQPCLYRALRFSSRLTLARCSSCTHLFCTTFCCHIRAWMWVCVGVLAWVFVCVEQVRGRSQCTTEGRERVCWVKQKIKTSPFLIQRVG